METICNNFDKSIQFQTLRDWEKLGSDVTSGQKVLFMSNFVMQFRNGTKLLNQNFANLGDLHPSEIKIVEIKRNPN